MSLILPMVPVMAEEDAATKEIQVWMDETKVAFNDDLGHPFVDDAGRTQMPFRAILEQYGATVSWDQANYMATAVKGDIEVQIPIGKKYIIRNNERIVMDTVSRIVSSRTYIPLRSVMEAFGAKVYWNNVLQQVEIDTGERAPIIRRMPSAFDLRTTDRLTEVKNQGNIGACWAFATLGAIESCLMPEVRHDFSEDHMSLTHGYELAQNEGGDFQLSLAYLARWSGPIYEEQDPYGDGVANEEAKAAVHVQEALILPKKDFSAVKRAVMTYGGVQTSIHIKDIASQAFGDAYNPETFAFFNREKKAPNHDVVIVGWDDGYSADHFNDRPERDGAFIARNSYGVDFGDEGYFYIAYEDTWVGDESIVYTRIEGNDNYDNIYQSDWLGWVGRVGFEKDSAWFANVYTAKQKEALRAVAFYATDRDTSYEVYVVPSFKGVDDYKNMTFITRGSLDYAGYYTIDFEEAVAVEGDYSVVVKIRTPDSLLPVAAEYHLDEPWLKDVNIADGRGYMSFDGQRWESTEEILQSNVALKAFTDNWVAPETEPTTEAQATPEAETTTEAETTPAPEETEKQTEAPKATTE